MRRSGGYSMVEVILVVTLIAIIIVIAVPSMLNARKAGFETRAISYLKYARMATQQYFSTLSALARSPRRTPSSWR